jgi:hypothetical protein
MEINSRKMMVVLTSESGGDSDWGFFRQPVDVASPNNGKTHDLFQPVPAHPH